MTDEKLFEHLEREVVDYIEQTEVEEYNIDVSDGEIGVRNLPIEVVGERRQTLDEIDFVKRLGPKQYEFALDYAFSGAKTITQLAKDHEISFPTAYKWLRKPEVQGLVAYVRSEHRAMALAQWLRLERKAFRAMERVLDKKISTGNIDAIGRHSWNIIKEGLYLRGASTNDGDPDNVRSGVSVNVNVAGNGRPMYRPKGDSDKPDLTVDDIHEVEREIHELEELNQVLEVDYEEAESGDE
jgi:transposase-like protein